MSAELSGAAPLAGPRMSLPWPLVWSALIVGLVAWGWHAHLERYISPQRGLGYALGITGGSMMVLLLIYSARKRAPWLGWMGGIPAWFQIHMVLGILGPLLILFHANFSLGATNSNVALICMLLVAGSGVVGRYIYTRLHAHMDGHESTLEELKAVGERLRLQSNSIAFLPGLLDAIGVIEKKYIEPPPAAALRLPHLLTGAVRLQIARYLVRRDIWRAMRTPRAQNSRILHRHAQRIVQAASRYADRRLEAGRRTAEYRLYAQMFSFWHVLHIPLFFMLLVAGIAHVIAVNIY
jgi:hypothetical protein